MLLEKCPASTEPDLSLSESCFSTAALNTSFIAFVLVASAAPGLSRPCPMFDPEGVLETDGVGCGNAQAGGAGPSGGSGDIFVAADGSSDLVGDRGGVG